ncbi:MAG: MFS transporter [Proteobacteria bacterium]|nr:MFS transporter [Pseudomonadota bacterium]
MTASSISATPAAANPAAKRRWLVAGVLLLVVIAGFFDRISIAVLFTNSEFNQAIGIGFNPPMLGLLMTSFLFAYGVSGVLLSFIGDIYGPRRSLAVGATLWGIFMVLIGAASSFTSMIIYRVLLGLAEGPQFALVNKVVKRWFPKHEQARANSVWMVGSPLGSAIGFPLTIALVAAFGWRSSFYALAILNIVIIVPLVLMLVRDWPPHREAEARAEEASTTTMTGSIGIFLKDWRFWMILLFNSACLVYLWGLNAWLPSYLQKVQHFDLKSLGFFASLPFILMFFGELLGGYISDRIGRRAIVCFVGLFMAGALIYVVSFVSNPYAAAMVMALSAGFWGSALPPLFAMAAQIIPPQVTASGVGVYNGAGNLIGACSPLLMGWIIGTAGNFNAGLLVLVGAGVIGSIAMLPLIKRY